MIQVGLLTEEQKDKLIGQQFMLDVYFNPIQDNNNNWVISIEEIDQCNNEFSWVKELELITYEPKKTVDEK
jgi:hypothetical protein